MAKLHFKPMPGLSLLLIFCVTILISLGVWQYHRLQWKTALLAEVEASVTAAPLTSLRDVAQAIAKEDPVDFRRVAFEASITKGQKRYHLYSSQRGGIYWDVFEPIRSQGITIFAKTDTLSDAQKDNFPRVNQAQESISLTGYIRKSYPMGRVESWVKSKANPDANRYFYFNQTGDWYQGLEPDLLEGYYIDVEAAESADALPIRRPDIANNHFDYMLTWWSFAVIFIVIYLILHRRAGRLAFR